MLQDHEGHQKGLLPLMVPADRVAAVPHSSRVLPIAIRLWNSLAETHDEHCSKEKLVLNYRRVPKARDAPYLYIYQDVGWDSF